MKKIIPVFLFLIVFSLSFLSAQTTDNPALFPLLHHFSSRNYTTEPVSRAEIDIIVQAGLRATSAGNRQPWLFTVVQNMALAREILPNITEGNVLIVVSGALGGSNRDAVILDCGLAAQSMFFAAQAMGLGARQYTNPTLIGSTNNLKSQLGIPADNTAIIVTQFGKLPAGVDVIGSASPRASADTKVIFR